MNAKTKRAVAIDLPIDQYLISVIKSLGIAIGCGEAEEDPVVLLHWATLKFEVVLYESSH